MRWGRQRRADPSRRRTGPVGEEPWWDRADQAFAEQPVLDRRDLGKGWIPALMLNNSERLDPYGDDDHSQPLRAARALRGLRALDEGAAFRQRSDGALAVVRVEVFADAAVDAHRLAWRTHGAPCLDAVWRARWTEREQAPGWIEARWRDERDRPAPFGPTGGDVDAALAAQLDWITIEDQTNTAETELVTRYEHLTLWSGRALATLIVRHDQLHDLDEASARAAAAMFGRLAALEG